MALGIIAGVGAAIGAVTSFAGTSSKNRQARSAARRQNEYNKKVYEYQYGDPDSDELGGEALRQYEYAVEGLEITKRNTESNLQFQEAQMAQQYDYQMGIRAYEYNQAKRAYDQSVSRALQQQSFNQLAEQAALIDQDRLYHEQLIGLALDETETLFNYGAAVAGVGLKKRQAKAAAVTAAQRVRIQALEATGASLARGVSGRTAAKNIQGLLAKSGAQQRAVVDEFLFNTEATDQDIFRLSQTLIMDQVGYELSRESAQLTDTAARTKIRAAALQAAIQAEASIQLKPEIAPPLPKPIALPRPEYQEVFKMTKPPELMEVKAQTSNPFLSAVGGAISGAQAGLSIGSGLGLGKNNTPIKLPGGGNSTFSGGVTIGPGQVSLGPTPVTLPGSGIAT